MHTAARQGRFLNAEGAEDTEFVTPKHGDVSRISDGIGREPGSVRGGFGDRVGFGTTDGHGRHGWLGGDLWGMFEVPSEPRRICGLAGAAHS